VTVTNAVATPASGFQGSDVRDDFPILRQQIHGKPLVYLDNAATTQKPQAVIDAITHYYTTDNANVHRGVHLLSERATAAFEAARSKATRFLNAASDREVIFVRGCTEGINLVAQSYGREFIAEGDEIIVSAIEHHSNIVPWQMLAEQTGAIVRVIPVNDEGELMLDAYERLLNIRTKLVAVGHISNALGTVNPIKTIIDRAHQHGAVVLIDGAQGAPHTPIDVQELGCDFYVFSGHKVFGPTGIGVLYGRESLLEKMPPWQGGGDMILSVSWEKTTWNALPFKFEAGTPNIAGAVGLGAALDYVSGVGLPRIAAWEHELLDYGTQRLLEIPRLRLVGTAREKASVLSFVLEGIHPHDIGTIVDQEGVAIRTGHHCAQPLMTRYGLSATARASIAMYNTKEDIDVLADSIHKVIEVFG
jgi:cysteine desulfurase / selenocysteine lyase